MKTENKRLLEAFEYLDEKYIDEMFDALGTPPCRKASHSGKRSYWYIPVLAACLLLLSMAAPVIGKVAEAIGSFAAGWGSGTETLEETETTNGMYGEYILTEEDLAQINEAYLQKKIADHIDEGFELSNEDIEHMRNSIYSKYASTVEYAMSRNKEDRFYFGKFGDCFIFAIAPSERPTFNYPTYVLGEYKIIVKGVICVAYNHEWIYLSEAYERGLLSDEDVAKLYEVYCKYYEGDSEK